MSVDGELGEAMDEEEERIESLKQQKAKDKSAFTRIKNKLLSLLDEKDYPSRREVKAACQKLCEVQERTMSTMEELSSKAFLSPFIIMKILNLFLLSRFFLQTDGESNC